MDSASHLNICPVAPTAFDTSPSWRFIPAGEVVTSLACMCAGSRKFNILAFAGLFAVATTVGGVLLTDMVDFGEVGVKEGVSSASAQFQQLTSAPGSGTDSKLLLEIVLALFGVTATGVGK